MTFLATNVATVLAYHHNMKESGAVRGFGLAIAKDLGIINRSYGLAGISQAMKLVRGYKIKCQEKGEACMIFNTDDNEDNDIEMDTVRS